MKAIILIILIAVTSCTAPLKVTISEQEKIIEAQKKEINELKTVSDRLRTLIDECESEKMKIKNQK